MLVHKALGFNKSNVKQKQLLVNLMHIIRSVAHKHIYYT